MNTELEKSFRKRLPPFHGTTLFVTEPVTFKPMSVASRIVIAGMKALDKHACYLSFADWHEHDGFRTEEEPFDLNKLEQNLKPAEALGAYDFGDTDVRRAVYPESKECLWRFGLDDCEWHGKEWFFHNRWNGSEWEQVTEPYWYFSLSGSPDFIESVKSDLETSPALRRILEGGKLPITVERSTEYFRRIDAS